MTPPYASSDISPLKFFIMFMRPLGPKCNILMARKVGHANSRKPQNWHLDASDTASFKLIIARYGYRRAACAAAVSETRGYVTAE